jgi:hypothetical protein
MNKTEITYLANFGSLGYYAQHQPDYNWSFTHDITKALQYKTLNGALDRLFGIGDLQSNHKYSQGRTLIERTSIIQVVNNTTTVSSTDKIISDVNAYSLYQTKENKKFQKKIADRQKKEESYARASEADRIKFENIFKKNISLQEEFYKPKCIDIQTELKTPEYFEKRNKLMIQRNENKSYTQFFKPYNSDGISQFFTLYQLFNTIKILFDNNQKFVLEDNNIIIDNDDMEIVRTIFMKEGVFKNEYCKFGNEKIFEW